MPVEWYLRKQQIGSAFFNSDYLSAVSLDTKQYYSILQDIGVADQRDICVLVSIVHDAIMGAKREGRPTASLEDFLGWLERKRDGV